MNIFVVEDMPRAVEELAAELWRRHPTETVLHCATAAKAHEMLSRLWRDGDIIILDRDDGTGDSFHQCVPIGAWQRAISISVVGDWNAIALFKGSPALIPKDYKDLAGWSVQVVDKIDKLFFPDRPRLKKRSKAGGR